MKKNRIILTVISFILIISAVLGVFKTHNIVYADEFDVKSYCLMDSNTGIILKEQNSEEKHEVASMVKLMTSLLAIEKIEKGEWSLDTTLYVSDYAASMEGSQAFLDAGKMYKIDDLLKSVIVASANDSSVVLAEGYAGTENAFVDIMNSKAKELSMEDTLYANSTGLPAFNQYSTAKDIAKLLNVVSKHELYQKYSKIWMDNLVHESGRITELVNTNRLIKYYPGCECGKTGFTDEAGYCLSVFAKRNDMNLISVVMGAKTSNDRFNVSSSLLNYGFSNFRNVKVVDILKPIVVNKKIKALKDDIECYASKDLYVLNQNGKPDTEYEICANFDDIKLPILKGDKIGTISVVINDKQVAIADLLAAEDYRTLTYLETIKNITNNWTF